MENSKELNTFKGECQFCNQPKNAMAVSLLVPDEKWICNGCLRSKARSVGVSKA